MFFTTFSGCTGWWFGTFFIFPHIGNVIIPIDELIFFGGVAQPPTRCIDSNSYGSKHCLRRYLTLQTIVTDTLVPLPFRRYGWIPRECILASPFLLYSPEISPVKSRTPDRRLAHPGAACHDSWTFGEPNELLGHHHAPFCGCGRCFSSFIFLGMDVT